MRNGIKLFTPVYVPNEEDFIKSAIKIYGNHPLQTYCMLLLTVLLSGCAGTVKTIESGGDWSGYDYTYFCPAYKFSNTGKYALPLDISGHNHISLAGPNALKAIDKAKDYIAERGGTDFLDKVSFYDVDITYADSADAFKNKRPLYNMAKCGDSKYFVRFLFSPQPETGFCFGVALNDTFEVISAPEFPDKNKNPDFYKVITPAGAYKTALKKHRSLIKDAETIELLFDAGLDYFVWEIKGKNEKGTKTTERIKGVVHINATTGEILDAEKVTSPALVNVRYF